MMKRTATRTRWWSLRAWAAEMRQEEGRKLESREASRPPSNPATLVGGKYTGRAIGEAANVRPGPDPDRFPEAAAEWARELEISEQNVSRYGSLLGACGHLGWYPGCPNCGGRRAT